MNKHQLKGKIKHYAKVRGLSAGEVLQMFFFEKFIERLSKSKYINNFIIKGGLLVAAIIGVENRTTLDMDTTVIGLPVKKEYIEKVILEIVNIENDDNVDFVLKKITEIKENDVYENYRIHLVARFENIENVLKLDITVGDKITPREILYHYPSLLSKAIYPILAYPIETLLSEKFETIISRNISTTRMRDFYDIYYLYTLKHAEINNEILREAIINTFSNRKTVNLLEEVYEIIEEIEQDEIIHELWQTYLNDNNYIGDLAFKKVIDILIEFTRSCVF